MSDLQTKLDLILEAPLAPELMAKVDDIIGKLQQLKEIDFGPSGKGFNGLDNQHMNHWLYEISSNITNIRYKGKTKEQIDKETKEAERSRILRQRQNKIAAKVKSIVAQFAEQFPRHISVLTDGFKLVQPNGDYDDISYSISPDNFIRVIEAFRELYRSGAYKEAEKRVQDIRDFGFNISSKLVSTLYSSFRTRYSIVSEVLLTYEGPMVVYKEPTPGQPVTDFEGATVESVFIPGKCNIKLPNSYFQVDNTTLDHIGEIIDTIDIMVYTTNSIGKLEDIQCMGQNVVEYQISNFAGQGRTVSIPSTMADNKDELRRHLFKLAKKR